MTYFLVPRSLTQSYPYPPQFEALILCEPMFGPTDMPRNSPVFSGPDLAATLSLKRRDTWPSRHAALSDFKTKRVFQNWDEEVLRAYIVRIATRDSCRKLTYRENRSTDSEHFQLRHIQITKALHWHAPKYRRRFV